MDISALDAVKDKLIKENHSFKNLVQQHHEFETRLTELAELTYPNDEELVEETTLKKKKLLIKDEIHAILEEYASQHT